MNIFFLIKLLIGLAYEILMFVAIRLDPDRQTLAHEKFADSISGASNGLVMMNRYTAFRAAGTPLGALVMLSGVQFFTLATVVEATVPEATQVSRLALYFTICLILLIATYLWNLFNRRTGVVIWIITLSIWILTLLASLFYRA